MKTQITMEFDTDGEHTPEQIRDAVRDWLDSLEHGDFTLWIHHPPFGPDDAEEIVINKIEVK